jgi:GNAT superfamily N-acetyltransferase
MELKEIKEASLVKRSALRERAERGLAKISHKYLAFLDGEEVAFVVLDLWRLPNPMVIYEIFVDPEFRKKGIGTIALSKIEQIASEEGYSEIVLVPRSLTEELSEKDLVRWYRKQGYEWKQKPEDPEPLLSKTLHD